MVPPTRYAESWLPTRWGAFRLLVYRVGPGAQDEAVALVHGEVAGAAEVLVRVHSECLTGEVFHSLRCDCRNQLDAAMARVGEAECGIIVYLRQEGRGIGLGNKVRAYALQDQGQDTVDANLALGFESDARSYQQAADILRDLGPRSIRLLTNNPAKIDGLVAAGIDVVNHESHWVGESEHNAAYLEAKRTRMGHLHDVAAAAAAQSVKKATGK